MNFTGRHRQRRHGRESTAASLFHPQRPLRIALAGNPNSGKTCLFNFLSGQYQHIGNYPGVTVEKKTGRFSYGEHLIELIDLPGIYSLTAYSLDEVVARDFLIKEQPDVIIDVLDSTNLERHLYLLMQFQEMGVPLVGALNMSDEAESKGIEIDANQLARILDIPFVKTIGNKGIGLEQLLAVAVQTAMAPRMNHQRHLNYGDLVETAHIELIAELTRDETFVTKYPVHWLVIKLLEKDQDAMARVRLEHQYTDQVFNRMHQIITTLEKAYGDDSRTIISEQRYAYIHGALRETVRIKHRTPRSDLTERVDNLLLHRFFGMPFFLLIMFLVYQLTFRLGNPLAQLIASGFHALATLVPRVLPEGFMQELLTEGIIDGVGGVLTFWPLVTLLMIGLAVLEDTGYMARAAFVTDKFFHIFGLHGRSFIPFMVSTGCAVPGIMSARLLPNPKDRIVTILVAPFMLCGAKAPVAAMIIAAFFPHRQALVFWLLWLFSWFAALTIALIFKKTLFRGEQPAFVMELPPYRLPTLPGILMHAGQRSWHYLKKAGTVILAASIIVWFALSFPKIRTDSSGQTSSESSVQLVQDAQTPARSALAYSYAGRFGRMIEPVLKLAGFDWKIGVSLVAGVAAKEVIVSTMGILYGIEASGHPSETTDVLLRTSLRNDPHYSALTAVALLIFVVLYTPCLATLIMVKKELRQLKWVLFQVGYTLLLAYGSAVLFFQVGLILFG